MGPPPPERGPAGPTVPNSPIPDFGGFDFHQLWLIRGCYRLLEGGSLLSLGVLAEALSTKPKTLGAVIRRFEERTKYGLFKVKHGQGRTAVRTDADATKVIERIDGILHSAEQVIGRSSRGFRIRLAAGVSACAGLLPRLLKEFRERHGKQSDAVPVTFSLYSVPHHSMVSRREEFDILLTELGDNKGGAGFRPGADVLSVPLCLLVPLTHPVAKQQGPLTVSAAVEQLRRAAENRRDDLPMAVLDETRQPRPSYPPLQVLYPNLRFEYVSTHMLAHSLVASGAAISLSTPLLLTDAERKEIRVIELALDDAAKTALGVQHLGEIIFRLDCPAEDGFRPLEERVVIRQLKTLLHDRIAEYGVEKRLGVSNLCRREAWHVSYRHGGDKGAWARGEMSWHIPIPGVFRGWYEFAGTQYHFEGNIADGGDDERHLVFKAVRDENNLEEFVGSLIGGQAALDGDEPLVGLWLGRRSQQAQTEPLQPSFGYFVLLPKQPDRRITGAYLNGLVASLRRRPELEGLRRPPAELEVPASR